MSDVVPAEIRHKLWAQGKFLVSKIDSQTIESIENWILSNRTGDDPRTEFTLIINSSGGSPGLILYFASFMRTLSPEVKITGVAYGECGSAALALLQLCSERVAVKHCGFFIHHINETFKVSCQSVNWTDLRKKIECDKKIEAELVHIQTTRSGISVQKWKSLAQFGENAAGSAIIADEAKQLGLIDRVVDSYPIF